ncbi:fatty acid desaturase [Thalassotalea psychrophila]|uniref:Fatty acid desaturase n=1 Tax=Thalassotalea psychrophila TaxID=3065647 RepID=A0ABY9U203_9GAMM|nr:fatty acid desaturase [Colwelliaceae bacterium SQ149]
MNIPASTKGQIPDKAMADLLLLSQRPEFKKLLDVPQVNWVLFFACSFCLAAWAYVSQLWLAGELSAIWLVVLSTYTFFIFLLTGHEAAHLSMARNLKINDWLATVLTIIPFPQLPILQWRHQHLTHHRDTCGEDDPDERLYKGSLLVNMFKVATQDFYWAYWSFRHRNTATVVTQWASLSGMAIYISILAVGLSSAYWYEFVMLYVLPQRIGFFVAIYMFAYVQHPPEKCSAKEHNPFKTTVVIRGFDSAFASVYFGQNRHLIHHLYPNMPIYRNWKAWQLGKDIFEQQELVNVGINSEHFEEISRQNGLQNSTNHQFMDVTIKSVTTVADGINHYSFAPAKGGEDFPTFKAGAHVDVIIEPGLIRQYSLCNASDQKNRYEIAVQCENDGRGGSRTLHEKFKVGDNIKISKPRNLFELKKASEVILFAGGIGITPMLAMAWTLHRQKIPFHLHYCTASSSKWAFKDHWNDLPFLANTSVYLDDDSSHKFNAKIELEGHDNADIYVCGPGGFMDYIEKTVMDAGFSQEQFNKESFKAGGELGVSENKSFTVKLLKSKQEIEVHADKSIVQALTEKNIFIPISCENGVCGTCRCKVNGEIEHRDMVLSDDEKNRVKLFTPCVSRSAGGMIELPDY